MARPLGEQEARDLIISAAGLGVAFTILFFGRTDLADLITSGRVIPALLISTAFAAVSFIPHAMAHRVTAQSMNAYAEYRLWEPGVLIGILSGFLGAVFAAPGGTRMHTREGERYGLTVPDLTVRMIGYTAVVGPLINIGLAVLFTLLAASFTVELYGVNLLLAGARINSFIAASNLLPFHPMDGYKILRWKETMWIGLVILTVITFLLPAL